LQPARGSLSKLYVGTAPKASAAMKIASE